MNRKLKYAFCNSNPGAGNDDIGIVAIDEQGKVFEGTIHGPSLTNWLATNARLTPVEGLVQVEAETARRTG
jgi:hypothetical protein